MLSLKNVVMANLKYDITDFGDVVLRHFPDPHDRTPNDPLYFISSDALIKFSNYLADKYDLSSAPTLSALTSTHVLLLRNYALSVGWSDVYLSGRQLVLESSFERGGVDLSDTWTNITGTVRLTADLNKVTQTHLLRNLAEVVPQVADLRAVTSVTEVSYAYNGNWLMGPREPVKLNQSIDGNPRRIHARIAAPRMDLTFDLETGILQIERSMDEEYVDAPDLHCFDVTYVVAVPTVPSN